MVIRTFLSQNQPTTQQRFRLLRNFSVVSLATFAIAIGVLSIFYRQKAVHQLVDLTERNNVSLAQMLSNTLWREHGFFLSSTQSISEQDLVDHPRTQQIYDDVADKLQGLPVLKIKIYDLRGRTVFSTELAQIGEDKSRSLGFLSAKSGQVVSQLGHRDTFQALQDTVESRDLLSSYVPIYSDEPGNEVVGIAELYTDVTPLLQRVGQTQRRVMVGSFLILSALYGILFLFIQRADYLLKTQYRRVQESESLYRSQAQELEDALIKLRQTQSQMLQSEKMSSLGQMVAGIAHEINNPVSFIHGNLNHAQDYVQSLLGLLELYQRHYPEPISEIQAAIDDIDFEFVQDDLPKVIASMNVGSRRIREIVLALRIFSRLDEAEIKPVNIHESLESTLLILKHRLKANPKRAEISIVREYGDLPAVECHGGLLNQVFMNILSNAIDALEETAEEGSGQASEAGARQITLRTSVVDERWVKIAIADNGPGIPPELQGRVFEPFFTTKTVGKGTGMGMSISYQIVTERHQGKLELFSTPGEGTEFVIRIPIKYRASGASTKSSDR